MQPRNRLSAYVRSASEGDLAPEQKVELEGLFSKCEAEVQAYIFTLLPHWPDVDDVLQRTRIILWQKFAKFQPGTSFKAWALQIARLEVNNFRRTQRRDRLCFDDSVVDSIAEARSSISEDLEVQRRTLEHCFRKLRASDRQIVRQCYGPAATTTKAAAERLRRPVNTLYKALIRIRRTLMECVQQMAGKDLREAQ